MLARISARVLRPSPDQHAPPPLALRPSTFDTDASGKVDRTEFQQLLDAIHARAGKPSVTMRKSVHSSK